MAPDFTARLLTGAEGHAAHLRVWEASRPRWLPQHPDVAASVGDAARWIVVSEKDQPVLALPFWERRLRGFLYWVQPPFLPFCGPCIAGGREEDEGFLRDALKAAAEALPHGIGRTEILFPSGLLDGRGLFWNGWESGIHYNYVSRWNGPGAWEAAWHSSARRQAAKARREGLTTAVQPPSDTATLERLWVANAGGQGLDPAMAPRIADLARALGPQRAFVVEVRASDGAPEAAGLFAHDAHRVYYLAGASDPARRGSGAPTLLHAGVLEETDHRGLPRCYDWVGANTPGVAQFKKKFGPELEPLLRARRESWALKAIGLLRRG